MTLTEKLGAALKIAAPQWSDVAVDLIAKRIASLDRSGAPGIAELRLENLIADLEIANDEADADLGDRDDMAGIGAAFAGEADAQRDQFRNRFREPGWSRTHRGPRYPNP